jgi:hypothetical protein
LSSSRSAERYGFRRRLAIFAIAGKPERRLLRYLGGEGTLQAVSAMRSRNQTAIGTGFRRDGNGGTL